MKRPDNRTVVETALSGLPAPGPGTVVHGLVQLVDVVLIQDHLDALTDAVVNWAARDETRAIPGVRQSANVAMQKVDLLLQAAYRLRSELTGQILEYDDASDKRVDALLADSRAARRCTCKTPPAGFTPVPDPLCPSHLRSLK